jgi:hypothetical protein
MRPLLLFADIREDPLRSPEVMWGMGMLIAAMLVGAAVIYAVDKWRQRAVAGPTDADVTGALTEYRQMYESGEITEAEYAELRRRVAEKVKAAPKPAAPAGTMPPLPPIQPGERQTVNPPAPPPPAPEPPKPPDSA